jgi:hypothetical protein
MGLLAFARASYKAYRYDFMLFSMLSISSVFLQYVSLACVLLYLKVLSGSIFPLLERIGVSLDPEQNFLSILFVVAFIFAFSLATFVESFVRLRVSKVAFLKRAEADRQNCGNVHAGKALRSLFLAIRPFWVVVFGFVGILILNPFIAVVGVVLISFGVIVFRKKKVENIEVKLSKYDVEKARYKALNYNRTAGAIVLGVVLIWMAEQGTGLYTAMGIVVIGRIVLTSAGQLLTLLRDAEVALLINGLKN